MPNFQETQQLIRRFIVARIPLIVVNTIEPTRVDDLFHELEDFMLDHDFSSYNSIDGLRNFRTNSPMSEDKSLLSALEQSLGHFKARANSNVIFHDIEGIDEDTTQARYIARVVREAERTGGVIILTADKPVWPGLSRLGMTVDLELPDKDELFETISGVLESNVAGPKNPASTISCEWGSEEIRRASEILAGITEAEAINVITSLVANGSVVKDDLVELSRFKDQIFGDLTGIERIVLHDDYKIGGLETLKAWLNKRRPMMTADLANTSLKPPRGILLCGVPGCGKSLSAKAIAQEWELPLYRMDLTAIQGMYHGQSETNLREALATADRVAPCVLWIDEIEKGLATSSFDNSVTRRLVGQFLFWLQESTSKVFLIATANDVSSLPPELLRKGRFDELFFVDLPTRNERKEILSLSFEKYLGQEPSGALLNELINLSEGFAGSDIDAVVHDIAADMFASGVRQIPDDAVLRSMFDNVVPFSQSNPEEVESIREWGAARAIPAGTPDAVVDDVLSNKPHRKFRRILV